MVLIFGAGTMNKMAVQIRRIINESEKHLTAEEIFSECKKNGVKASVASVYRNLAYLAAEGCIKRLSFSGEPDRYDKSVLPHEHLICERCGRISDIGSGSLKQLLEKHFGTEIASYELSMRYVCPECSQKAEKDKN